MSGIFGSTIFSKMLIYIIVFGTISLCSSAHREVGDFSDLILVQTYAPSPIFYEEIYRTDVLFHEISKYLRIHQTILEMQSWIVSGLLPLDSNRIVPTNCVSSSGQELTLNLNNMDPHFKRSLKKKWPSLQIHVTDENNWSNVYREFGSCVSENASLYFETAMHLSQKYDLKNILHSAGFEIGRKYTSLVIEKKVSDALGRQVLVECIHPLNYYTLDQYLLRIYLCYNANHDLTDCKHGRHISISDACETNRLVTYPKAPPEYTNFLDYF